MWKLDNDQVKSAVLVLEAEAGTTVERIPIVEESGISTIAFAFKEVVDAYGDRTEEVAMDSTCTSAQIFAMSLQDWIYLGKTNAAGYELYGLIGEANGQALPLGFIFTAMTDGTATKGAKQRMLEGFLPWFTTRCPNIKFTLSDKDPSEIGACRTKITNAKHQLCYWHGVRYIEERLAEDKPPAKYDPRKANLIFPFIDPTWAPGITRGDVEEYLDGRDIEGDASVQGGVRQQLLEARQVSNARNQSISQISNSYSSRKSEQHYLHS